jgi:hypothetical protein
MKDITKSSYLPVVISKKTLTLYTLPWLWFELTTSVVIGTDCIGSCKSKNMLCRKRYTRVWFVVKWHFSFLPVVFSGSSVNKTDRHDITEIVLKVALNTIIQTYSMFCCHWKIQWSLNFVCDCIERHFSYVVSNSWSCCKLKVRPIRTYNISGDRHWLHR